MFVLYWIIVHLRMKQEFSLTSFDIKMHPCFSYFFMSEQLHFRYFCLYFFLQNTSISKEFFTSEQLRWLLSYLHCLVYNKYGINPIWHGLFGSMISHGRGYIAPHPTPNFTLNRKISMKLYTEVHLQKYFLKIYRKWCDVIRFC